MKKVLNIFISILILLFALTAVVSADTEFALANFYTNNMVLQAESDVVISGSAKSGSEITAVLSDGTKEYKADSTAENNRFTLKFNDKFEPGYTEYTLTVTDGSSEIKLSNIVFGDVYLLAGQSNMEYNMETYFHSESKEFQEQMTVEMESCNNPYIRAIRAANFGAQAAEDDISLSIKWKQVEPSTVGKMSAIGYYFAKEIQPYCDYPIGLLDFAWSGSMISPWLEGGDIYNTHIYPIRNLSIKACLWYQGESDENEDSLYFDRQVEFIETLREMFGEDLPFGYVQLANYSHSGRFHFIRREQLNVFNHYENKAKESNVLNTVGMISIVDQIPVDFANIHPSGKDEVASRLVTWAKAVIYDEGGEYSGPVPVSAKLTDNGVVVTYDHIGSGLTTKDGQSSIEAFTLYDEKGNYAGSQGIITGDDSVTVRVALNSPVKIAYAYAPANYGANLINKENFAATAFAPMDIDVSNYNPVITSNGAKLRGGNSAEMIIVTKDIPAENVEISFESPLEITRENLENKIVLTVSVPVGTANGYYPVYYSYNEESGFAFVQVHDGDLGDVNGDGVKNDDDLFAILRNNAGYNENVVFNNADVNEDSIINLSDAYEILSGNSVAVTDNTGIIEPVDEISVFSGERFVIPVKLTGDSVTSVRVSLESDDVFDYVDVKNGEVFPVEAFYASGLSNKNLTSVWFGEKSVSIDGGLGEFVLAVKQGTPAGKYSVTLYVEEGDLITESGVASVIPVTVAVNVTDALSDFVKGSMSNIVQVANYYDDYYDVLEEDWYYPFVKSAFELGFIDAENSAFDAFKTLSREEAIELAAKVNAAYYGKTITGSYVDYAYANGIAAQGRFEDLSSSVTRSEFVDLIFNALPCDAYERINMTVSIPDVTAENPYYDSIYTLYSAGILMGGDDAGNFYPDSYIEKCEAAALLERLGYTEKRIKR